MDKQFHKAVESDEDAGEFKAKEGPITTLQRISRGPLCVF
jgi:hypothetical protein